MLIFRSGHAAVSIGLLTYILLELFILHPDLMCGLTCQKRQELQPLANGENVYVFEWGYGWQKQPDLNEEGTGGGGLMGIDVHDVDDDGQ